MSLIEEWGGVIEAVFAEAAAWMAALPAPLDAAGQELLESVNPLRTGPSTNAICFLLPFWIGEETDAPDSLCRELAVGNVYAMLHYGLLDDAMDASFAGEFRERSGIRVSLALGQMLQDRFRELILRRFPADSVLWTHARRYTEAWAAAVSSEGAEPADPRDAARLAAKAAPVKLCAAGLLLAAGLTARLPALEEAVDLALATLQLSDDWADWKDDLAQGEERSNAFLTLVRETLQLSADTPLYERSVRGAILRGGALSRLADIADGYGARLGLISGTPAGLKTFQREIAADMRRTARKTEDMIYSLASMGSLSYIMSKKEKK